MGKINFFWFRRDLRLEDNAGLYHALKGKHKVQCVFIFDTIILDELPKDDARVTFIHDAITNIDSALKNQGSSLLVKYGNPLEVWKSLTKEYDIASVYTNKDFEPYAKERDEKLTQILSKKGAELKTYKDHIIFEGNEVLKDDGKPYTVFTPYKNKWYAKLKTDMRGSVSYFFTSYPTEKYFKNFIQKKQNTIPTLESMGFVKSLLFLPSKVVNQQIIKDYTANRDFPAINGTTRLGLHFRFGTISIREKARKASNLNETYLNELVWRDFYSQILYHFPQVVGNAFRPEYDKIEWRESEEDLEKWKNGMTGYPIVDAGMRELNATGHMHNRVRMVVASFFTKHLLLNWRYGEAYFAEKLLDYDLASNNGGWQWAAGCGTDAAPYFRIFSPAAQEERFDKQRVYIKKWVPEVDTSAYPKPMVDHKYARERCLEVYKKVLKP